MRTLAVLGGNGFIGRHLVDALTAADVHRVHVFSRRVVEPRERKPGVVRYVTVDMRDEVGLRSALGGVNALFHLGATIPNAFAASHDLVMRGNVEGAEAVVSACRAASVKSLVYVTGHLAPPPEGGGPAFLHAKAAAEEIVLAAHGKDGLAACSVRAPVVFGPGDKISAEHLKGRAPVFPAFPRTFSFMHVADLVQLLALVEARLAARDAQVAGRALDVRGERMTFADFFSLPAWGRPPPRFVSYRLLRRLAAVNALCARLAGAAPLGAEMCPEVLDALALHHVKEGGADAATALGLGSQPPKVARGIRALVEDRASTSAWS